VKHICLQKVTAESDRQCRRIATHKQANHQGEKRTKQANSFSRALVPVMWFAQDALKLIQFFAQLRWG